MSSRSRSNLPRLIDAFKRDETQSPIDEKEELSDEGEGKSDEDSVSSEKQLGDKRKCLAILLIIER